MVCVLLLKKGSMGRGVTMWDQLRNGLLHWNLVHTVWSWCGQKLGTTYLMIDLIKWLGRISDWRNFWQQFPFLSMWHWFGSSEQCVTQQNNWHSITQYNWSSYWSSAACFTLTVWAAWLATPGHIWPFSPLWLLCDMKWRVVETFPVITEHSWVGTSIPDSHLSRAEGGVGVGLDMCAE
jgi:hypothetical protein